MNSKNGLSMEPNQPADKPARRVAFKMKLNVGNQEEYKKRHDKLWPELNGLLKGAGIHNYSIFLDEESYSLFAIMTVENQEAVDALPNQPVMKKWWAYMKDIMETHEDHSPVTVPLKEMFYMP
jgi:L-rhamnose mutarotase